jgi:hypothetical protein
MVDGQPKEVSVWIFTKDSLPDYGATLQELKAPNIVPPSPTYRSRCVDWLLVEQEMLWHHYSETSPY